MLVGVVKGIEVVVIDVVAVKDIGDEFHDRGLPDANLANKEDSVWCSGLSRRTLDDPHLERLYVAGKCCQYYCTKGEVVSYLMLPSSSPFNGPLRGPVELSLEGTSSLRTIRIRNCPRPVRYSRFGPDLSSNRHGHDLDGDTIGTESTESLMKGSDGQASSIYGLAGIRPLSLVRTPLASALNSLETDRKWFGPES